MGQVQAIAHYLVERELGRGAMGVVYSALDTKLGRPVAIKSLPSDIASDPVRRDRFEGEARTLAAINHPNIGSIYGLEQQDGSSYLVLEFVEGPTLTDQLQAGPMELADAIDICRQVALGIDAANERGIIHRDLKPDNIKIRPDGVVKVLDFGIAMAGEVMRETSPTAATIVQPTSPAHTRTGFIIGTPGYMSPEQARGKAVSRATDLWALGCILYECLTGCPAFGGESLADALASTLMGEPDLGLLPPKTPARVLDLLRHALQKDARKRTRSVGQAAEELDKAARELVGGTARLNISLADDGDWPDSVGNVPEDVPAPAGRDAEIARATQLRASSRLLTITGPEGSGRARVAIQAARASKADARAGLWMVRLPAMAEPELPALLSAFVLRAKGGSASPDEAVARRIAARQVLLVLDGCHHAPTACATLVHDLLHACPNLRIITTARAPLGLEGEAELKLPSLLGDPAAARLVVLARAAAAKPGAESTPDAEAAADAIVKRLGGWPLALEIAGSMATSFTLREIADQLDERARHAGLAASDPLNPEAAHRIVTTWVLDLLPPTELAVVLQASVFVGPFGVRALAAVSGARDSLPRADSDDVVGGPLSARESRLLALLPRLTARGLMGLEGQVDNALGVRAWLPEPVRLVAIERLAETPAAAAAAVAAGHRAYYLASAEQASSRWAGPAGGAWLSRSEEDLPELLQAAQTPGGESSVELISGVIAAFRAARGL